MSRRAWTCSFVRCARRCFTVPRSGTAARRSEVMTLMTVGPYEEPAPMWLPSIAY